MVFGVIDVWDPRTFDCELSAALAKETDLVRNYMTTDVWIFLNYDHVRRPDLIVRPENPYASAFLRLKEIIGEMMQFRTVRAWHYTRLTDAEVEDLWHDGIHLSTPAALRARLKSQVACGELNVEVAETLYVASPFNGDQLKARSGKFWMTSHPLAIHDDGVERLLRYWGGEVASFWQKDPTLLATIAVMGRPRVIELAVPLALTTHGYCAGDAVIAAFGRALGRIPGKHAFDLYVTAPLSSGAILKVHSEGDSSFRAMGLGYPEDYVDVDIGRWKELTGEDE
jgi:hypothetical protein